MRFLGGEVWRKVRVSVFLVWSLINSWKFASILISYFLKFNSNLYLQLFINA